MVQCSGCNLPIVDKYLLKVLDCMWHTKCLQCYECKHLLTEKCYSREGNLYCAKDFYRFVTIYRLVVPFAVIAWVHNNEILYSLISNLSLSLSFTH